MFMKTISHLSNTVSWWIYYKYIGNIQNSGVSSEIKFKLTGDKDIDQDTPKFSDTKHSYYKKDNDHTGGYLNFDYVKGGKQVILVSLLQNYLTYFLNTARSK